MKCLANFSPFAGSNEMTEGSYKDVTWTAVGMGGTLFDRRTGRTVVCFEEGKAMGPFCHAGVVAALKRSAKMLQRHPDWRSE